jgi:hypothetical protein
VTAALPHVSSAEDLTLHGPRVLGFASASRIAARYGLDPALVRELLLDHQARGFVHHSSFGDSSGWSVTETGRVEGEARLARELDAAGAREVVAAVHRDFVPLNRRFTRACTRWQVRPTRLDPMASNDHSDWGWDEGVLRSLTALGTDVRGLGERLSAALQRFDGYAERYAAALARVESGERRWVDAPEVDSCHTVWIQLHEDLLATLGIVRGTDG